jgi:hypothetical protein
MAQQLFDYRVQWTKHERIAGLQRRRQWAIFGAHVEVTFTKHHRTEAVDIVWIQRRPASQSHFDWSSRRLMNATQTRRHSRGIVCDYEIIRVQKFHERAARHMNQIALLVNNEQLRINRSLHRHLSG